MVKIFCFFFSSRRRHTRCYRDWSSDVCSSDLGTHDWRLFIRPAELDALLRRVGLAQVATAGLAPRIRPGDVASALLRRRLTPPPFAVGRGRRAIWLGHYRKEPAPSRAGTGSAPVPGMEGSTR